MNSPVKKEILAHLNEHKISVAELERKAGLKMNAIRNILNGRSRKPSGETLKAVANALGCSLDLLLTKINLKDSSDLKNNSFASQTIVKNDKLFFNTVQVILDVLKRRDKEPTLDQLFFLIRESYCFFLTKNPQDIDNSFIEWIINKNLQ